MLRKQFAPQRQGEGLEGPSLRDSVGADMRARLCFGFSVLGVALSACATPPPASILPNAQAAIDRMRASTQCGNALQAEAKIDHFGKDGRIRASLMLLAARPTRVRFDVVEFSNTLATLTSDGTTFALSDLREKRFLLGPASACNIARLTQVPVPANVLVDLFRGQASILKHAAADATVAWSGKGYYLVTVVGTRDAREEVRLAVHPDDWTKPWGAQRLRVVDVRVWQRGVLLYEAQLEGHEAAATAPMPAATAIDPVDVALGVAPVVAEASGPACQAEVPRRMHLTVPSVRQDVLFRYDSVLWNPALTASTFVQSAPSGTVEERVTCDDDR